MPAWNFDSTDISEIAVFDFDQTITRHHTFNPIARKQFTPATNIKTGVMDYFKFTDKRLSAIATYHDDPEYVKSYIEYALEKPLTLAESFDFEHTRLSVYMAEGLPHPIVISSLQPTDFDTHLGAVMPEGKNTQILNILSYLKVFHGLNYSNTHLEFYDDTYENIFAATHPSSKVNLLDKVSHISTHYVIRNAPDFTLGIPKDVHAEVKVSPYSSDSLKACTRQALDEYLNYSNRFWSKISIFHRHGPEGQKRAIDFFDKLFTQKEENTAGFLLDFLENNNKNGNTYPHSFRTLLLKTMSKEGLHWKNESDFINNLTELKTSLYQPPMAAVATA
ncbi:hypothetical protein Lqui_0628 [Legionella quinlivanii]|uniref:Dot/Icm T4SS effector n=1 Tax=Legionella quinlivanii TaxID=45073 RepID=A0A0W0Y4C3_9GAMM|nr:hypothetical protein [Legionella quinlivanii]KTD51784.1 hypothetical protein Lqui_0628 [Legionella quinlivanii]SEF66261.1 hypothetical protein SAMN02746093_00768 [Legionella quinlivanii DSM 21216]STY10688.1 Uncharacterised protein [Legionella quinlivanii]